MGMKSLDSKSTATTRPAGSKSQLEAWPSRFLTSRNLLGNVRRNESTKSSAFVGLNKVLDHILRWAFSGCQADLPAGGSPAMRQSSRERLGLPPPRGRLPSARQLVAIHAPIADRRLKKLRRSQETEAPRIDSHILALRLRTRGP